MLEVKSPKESEKKDGFDKWEVDSAVETLLKAEEIKQNKKLFALAQEKLHGKMKAIRSIADIKEARDKMISGDDDGDEDSGEDMDD